MSYVVEPPPATADVREAIAWATRQLEAVQVELARRSGGAILVQETPSLLTIDVADGFVKLDGFESSFPEKPTRAAVPDLANDQLVLREAGLWLAVWDLSADVRQNREYTAALFYNGLQTPSSLSLDIDRETITPWSGHAIRLATPEELPATVDLRVAVDQDNSEFNVQRALLTAVFMGD